MTNGEWKSVALDEVATIEREAIQPAAIGQGTPYLGLEHIEIGGKILGAKSVDEGELASSKFKFTERHVLYGKLRPYLAKIACPDFSGICSTDILPILPGPDLERRFLCYFLRQPSMVDYANSRAAGANLPRLSPSALSEFEIPLPPLVEQRWIADVLDRGEALRAKRRAALVQLDSLAQSLFLDLFGDPATNPKGWPENTLLGEVADIVSGITKGRKLNGEKIREVPYLAVANVQDRALNLAAIKSIEATDKEIARYRLLPNDLVLTEGGDPDKLGRGTLWNAQLSECIHQNHIFRVRLTTDRVSPLFANWLISGPRGKRYFLKSAKQTTGIASINMTQLRGFPLLIPPINLQREFARQVTAVEALKTAHRASLAELDALFATLQHRAFRGEL
ncbi:MAG: restriction endonuclease subunit S [Gammaproteobacteria bacterium]|nr:restriction endonuclease subunit S [Gammaproteobacteria bacterium]